MKTTVVNINSRKQLGKYLEDEARRMSKLYYQRSVLRELVTEAFECRDRMPKLWTSRARKALEEITE